MFLYIIYCNIWHVSYVFIIVVKIKRQNFGGLIVVMIRIWLNEINDQIIGD